MFRQGVIKQNCERVDASNKIYARFRWTLGIVKLTKLAAETRALFRRRAALTFCLLVPCSCVVPPFGTVLFSHERRCAVLTCAVLF